MAPRFRPVALRPHLSAGLPKISNFNMPNKLHRNKRRGSRNPATNVSKPFRTPHSVKEVLGRATPALTRLTDQASRQGFWKHWLAQHVPAELAARLSGVVERDDTLVIFAESAAWSARLRYVIQELESQIKQAAPTIQHVSVRVMPKA
jgi:Dna[CI] antecedent, DciA